MGRAVEIPVRHEFKYPVSRSMLPALRSRLVPFCDRDENAGPDGTYLLRSLYLDTLDLRLFHANEREAGTRFKARLRGYPEALGSPVFAEVKNRIGDAIRKTRGVLPPVGWERTFLPGVTSADASPGLQAFLYVMHRHDLRPTVLVQYRREAWAGRWEDYARVSIDTAIECQRAHGLSLDPNGPWRPIDHALFTHTPDSVCVVELKFPEVAPRWMVDLVQQLDLLRHAFSKYCHSMLSLAADHHRDRREAGSPWA